MISHSVGYNLIPATVSNACTSLAEWGCYNDRTVEVSCSRPHIHLEDILFHVYYFWVARSLFNLQSTFSFQVSSIFVGLCDICRSY